MLKTRIFSLSKLPNLAILFIALIYLITNFSHHKWTRHDTSPRGVIAWDVISYYAYLPATFIYKDIGLEFLDDEGFVNDDKFWFVTSEKGKRVILTSMGVSIMYAPFFFVAHTLAPVFGESQDGFGSIYQLFIVFSSFFYLMLAFVFLKNLLARYFLEKVSTLVIIILGLGTNLYYYGTYEAAMSHAFSFSLIVIFLELFLRWNENPGWKKSILPGIIFGIIVLIRPTNILIALLFPFFGVISLKSFGERILFLLRNYRSLLLMMLFFVVAWIPQFIYWYTQTGQLFYNAYEEVGSAFYLSSPHIMDMLFSFRKGWLIYIPVMSFAIIGIFFLRKKTPQLFIPIMLYFIISFYLLSSWWSWWNGGSYGPRSLIDLYPLLSFPLAAFVDFVYRKGLKVRIAGGVILLFFIFLNFSQIYQYNHGTLHYLGMTKEAYKIQFLKYKTQPGYWTNLSIPDFVLARKGIYYFYSTGDDYDAFAEMDEEKAMELLSSEMVSNKKIMKEIRSYAKREKISDEESFQFAFHQIYKSKREGGP